MTHETLSTLQTEVRERLYWDENKLSRINIKSPRVHMSAAASYYTLTTLSLSLSGSLSLSRSFPGRTGPTIRNIGLSC